MSKDKKTIRVLNKFDVPVINDSESTSEFIKNFSDRNKLTDTKENLHAEFLAVLFSADRSAVILSCEARNFTFIMSNDNADSFADLIKQAAAENRKNL